MIIIKLKFLLAFSPRKKDITKKKKKEIKEKKGKPGGATKKGVSQVPDPPYLIRLEKTFQTAHVEYELIPGKCKYQFDVLCWSKAAKIYTVDGVKMFKTVTRNELTFVPICIEHFLKELSTDDLIALQSSVIEFNVFSEKNKLGNVAKANKTEMVYIKETDIDGLDFIEAYTEKVNVSLMSAKKSTKTFKYEDLDDILLHSVAYQKNEAYSTMHFEDNFAEKLYDIIEFITNDNAPKDLVQFKDFVKSYNPDEKPTAAAKNQSAKKGAADKKTKKEGKKVKGEKAPTKLTLQMQGEIMFTDPNEAIFRVENKKFDISKFFVVLQVQNLLTRSQKIFLNPIVIKTMHISHVPVDIFENTGFTDVYCKYSIPCIAECKTIEKPIENFIRFNESHIYFTHTLSKIKLLEFLASKRLIVEVYGVKRLPFKEALPKLFGEKPTDGNISKIHTKILKKCLKNEENLENREEQLAHCSFDLSSLLRNVWDFREKAQLHNIDNSTFLRKSTETIQNEDPYCDFWSSFNASINTINLANIQESLQEKSTSPLKEWILIENVITLSLEAYLLSPQAAALVLHQIPNTYKRLFFVAFNRQVAIECFTKILQHNQRILWQKLNTEDMLTGWVLDNGNNIAIYFEGLAVGYILNIWQELYNLTSEDAKIFFNTDQAYEKRIYNLCNKWSGFYLLTLRVPLDMIFKDYRLYIKGNAPLLCLKALMKLNMLFYSRTLKGIMQYDLFPTIEELISLDLEYGVPYGWQSMEPSVESDATDKETIRSVYEMSITNV